jgi:hypothetical protein
MPERVCELNKLKSSLTTEKYAAINNCIMKAYLFMWKEACGT